MYHVFYNSKLKSFLPPVVITELLNQQVYFAFLVCTPL